MAYEVRKGPLMVKRKMRKWRAVLENYDYYLTNLVGIRPGN